MSRGNDGTDGLTDAERAKRKKTARAIGKAKAAERATAGKIEPKLAQAMRDDFAKDPLW